jgi:PAS domain S-box-containing protein
MSYNSLVNLPDLARKLFDEVPASIIVIDRTGKILAVNRGFSLYTSKPGSEMVGHMLLDSKEIADPILRKKFRSLLKSGKPFLRHIFKHHATSQNRWYTMSLSAVPLKDDHNEIVGAVSIAQDISSLVETQQQLEVANAQLRRRVEDYNDELLKKQKELELSMTSRNRFFADASHELRTPLTIIKGNIDLIKLESYNLPPALSKRIKDISLEAMHMSQLLSDITTLNRGDSLADSKELNKVALDELVKNVLRQFFAVAKRRKITISASIKPVFAMADEASFSKVVNNLVSNALRYNEKCGTIAVRLFQKSSKAILEVKDSGIGIGKKDLPHIFDRFYRADQARARVSGGTGLGLAICSHIVKQHHGTIKVKSIAGKGTTFIVTMPLGNSKNRK